MPSHEIKTFKTGVVNRPDTEDIKSDAFKDSLGWIVTDGRVELSRGKEPVGTIGSAGQSKNVWVGYKTDGTAVIFAHMGDAIKYYNGSSWVAVANLTSGITSKVTFSNYSSLAGAFVYIGGPSLGIYKINTANPGSSIWMSDAAKNWNGYIFIEKQRMWLWGRIEDRTGLYASYIDKQDGTVYTKVTDEVVGTGNGSQTVFTGTLAFKGIVDGAKRNCFGLLLTTPISAADNFVGGITGTGVTGTINYMTGAYSITYTVAPTNLTQIKLTYYHENSNAKGITDFTYSTPRLKGEGFVLRQDLGGDPILNFIPSSDGTYVSVKERSSYEVKDISGDDSIWTNLMIRTNMGVPSMGAVITSDKGVIFLNTAQPQRPELTLLVRNPIGNTLDPKNIGSHFAWEDYRYDEAAMGVYGQFIVLSCKDGTSTVNNKSIMIDVSGKNAIVLPVPYGVTSWATAGSVMYGGSPLTETVYKIFSGYDDENEVIENTLDLKDEDYGSKRLKKYMRLRLRGFISAGQAYDVYQEYDRSTYLKIGEILGNASYVDSGNSFTVGSNMVGEVQIGGEGTSIASYYETEITRIPMPRYKVVSLRFVAKGIGYASIDEIIHEDILTYEDRIAKRFR